MSHVLQKKIHTWFAPPQYLSPPLAGIDLSASGVKAVRVVREAGGLILSGYIDIPFTDGAYTNGDVVDRSAVLNALTSAATTVSITSPNVALPETKSYIFETTVTGKDRTQWRIEVEQHLEELVPLPPPVTSFDIVETGHTSTQEVNVVGVGLARRVVDDILTVFDEAHLDINALEPENFAIARALLPFGDQSTVLIVDIGKSTTKICIVSQCTPRFATTIGIGGHAITLAIEKYFGVTETEAKKIKLERGIAPALGNEECLAAVLSTVSAIRDEISNRLDYWQAHAAPGSAHEPVTHAILSGGNATVRGLQEHLQNAFKIPVIMGDVFTNFAPRSTWLPAIDYNESLAYATAIGLALHGHQSS